MTPSFGPKARTLPSVVDHEPQNRDTILGKGVHDEPDHVGTGIDGQGHTFRRHIGFGQ